MFSSQEEFKEAYLKKLEMTSGKAFPDTTLQDRYDTLGQLIREYISMNWIQTNEQYRYQKQKQVYYLSIEFLLGRLLRQNLMNLGIYELVEEGLGDLGIDLKDMEDVEQDAALGNGGLGRLAACFLDSMASMDLPGHGYGIRYKHGLFEQKIVNGYQMELPEQWLRHGYVWEVRKPDLMMQIPFWGRIESSEKDGVTSFRHVDAEIVAAVPYDLPVVGYGTTTVNTLRLWNAEPYAYKAGRDMMKYKRDTEAITEFLYPDDTQDEGKVLRLKQQYFLVSASIRTILESYLSRHGDLANLHEHVAIHINDTHPVLAIPEMMRVLIDEYGMDWDSAWGVTTKTFAYTNHTTLSEALERWPVRIFQPLLPRIYMIVDEINERFCRDLWDAYPGEWGRIEGMAIIAHGEVKMAHLAIAGSHSVNGVAKIHTDILKEREMNLFYQYFPGKFNSKTNGITHRRWLLNSNPPLASLIQSAIGDAWIKDPSRLTELESFTADSTFLADLHKAKQLNKKRLADRILQTNGIVVDPDSIFDIQIKRLHAYKRQLLNILHILHLFNRCQENPDADIPPRTFIFGAKASPGYYYAKKIIKLIHSVADLVNDHPAVKGRIKVVFLENYRVSLAEEIIPAADVSQQISTASKEASGTGNMKFMMNGALTLGTLDGANIEIQEQVGDENIFIFGLKAEEVMKQQQDGSYYSMEYYHHDERIKKMLDQLIDGSLPDAGDHFETIYDSLLAENDEFFVLRDFDSYAKAHEKVASAYRDQESWLRMSLINIARSGYFSSDRTIAEYAREIWRIGGVGVR
ncbi:glycogen/starch/alpha-glucan phosphorylase [Rossellomorea marisflavi]|uniref:glycogen/starch/alpha-glucan phosphorylase n=1 Tax=Rossellomorea marisflavi TaxID=189381 RepID=UPI00285304D2|nr:glycogen/starch/alpha-glucan phosphorylase [Rossellomorea marisflavi]MDR4935815.1 glycogen/starch/alpha-glucan phosphorylase [Rossellomorea marisflavi]